MLRTKLAAAAAHWNRRNQWDGNGAYGEPRTREIHDPEFNIVKYLNGQFDPFLITKDVEEEVINGIAQIVLSHIVRPDVDNEVRFDDLDDIHRDEGRIITTELRAVFGG
jgi:hypothetical protein